MFEKNTGNNGAWVKSTRGAGSRGDPAIFRLNCLLEDCVEIVHLHTKRVQVTLSWMSEVQRQSKRSARGQPAEVWIKSALEAEVPGEAGGEHGRRAFSLWLE